MHQSGAAITTSWMCMAWAKNTGACIIHHSVSFTLVDGVSHDCLCLQVQYRVEAAVAWQKLAEQVCLRDVGACKHAE